MQIIQYGLFPKYVSMTLYKHSRGYDYHSEWYPLHVYTSHHGLAFNVKCLTFSV